MWWCIPLLLSATSSQGVIEIFLIPWKVIISHKKECKRSPISLYIWIWNKQNVSHGPYLCPKHTKCHSCGSTVPGNGLSVRLVFFFVFLNLNLESSFLLVGFECCPLLFFLCLDPISTGKLVFMIYYVHSISKGCIFKASVYVYNY